MIFYKEWIKTRLAVALAVAVGAGLVVYALIDTASLLREVGAVEAWNAVITKDLPLLTAAFEWYPLFAGLTLALAQFAPEMAGKRLKLTLHLPLTQGWAIGEMLRYGVAVLAAILTLVGAALVIGLGRWFPHEIVVGMVARSAPWFIGGLFGYLACAWIALEPTWRRRIMNAILAMCLGALFFIGAASGGMVPMLPWLSGLTVLSFMFPFYSAARFKEGVQ